MSELKELMNLSDETTIMGVKMRVPFLRLDELELFDFEGTEEDLRKKNKQIVSLIKTIIKRAIPDSTEEELNSLPVKFIKEVMQFVMKENGIDQEVNPAKSHPLEKAGFKVIKQS